MSKISLTNLVNLTNQTTAVNAINANNAALTTALDNTLSRDGTSPNTMSASLDMNSNRILNLAAPSNPLEPVRLQDLTETAPPWASINSPHFIGVPTAPTATLGTDTTQIATTAFVDDAIDVVETSIAAVVADVTALEVDFANVKWRVDVTDYGAVGDGLDASASTNATAFAAAVAALPSTGGQVFIPQGRYHTNGPLANLLDKRSIEFLGVGSGNGQMVAIGSSEVVYTANTGALITCDGTHAITFRNLTLSYNSPTYTANNVFINLRRVSGAAMTFGTLFENCSIGGWNTSAKNALMMDVGKTIWTTIKRGYFRNVRYGVIGAHNVGDTTNCTVIDDCEFDRDINLAVLAGGVSWRLTNIIAEPPLGSAGSLTLFAISPLGVDGLYIDGCSFEDGGAATTGAWLEFGNNTDFGTQGSIEGLSIIGNYFQNGIGYSVNFGTAGCIGGVITGNHFNFTGVSTVGCITNGNNASDMLVLGNNTNSASGPGTGVIFAASLYPGRNSVFDNIDTKGLRTTGRVKTVATLPAGDAGLIGERFMVTDANATTFMTVVAAGGANAVPVIYDGTNWRIG